MTLYQLAEKADETALKKGSWTPAELNWKNPDGQTALMRAAARGDHKTASLLAALGADLDLTDKDGRKAVDLAALNGQATVLACLIRGGCGG